MKPRHTQTGYLLSLFYLLLLVNFAGYAQDAHLQDSLTVQRLADSAKNSWDADTDKALQFANQVLDLSQKHQYTAGIVKGYVLLGSVHDRKSLFPQAVAYYQQALDIAKKENYTREMGAILYNMATTYFNQSAYDKSFEAGTACLAIKKALKDTAGISKCYRVLAEVYTRKQEYDKAIPYIENAVAIQRQLKSKRTLANILNSAGVIYMESGNYNRAIVYMKEAEGFIESEEGASIAQGIYNNIGLCYDRMGKIDSAEHYYLLALKSDYLDSELQQVIVLNNLGQIYLAKGKDELAEKYLLKALAQAKELNSIEDLSNIHSNLADLYYNKKEFKKAYDHEELHVAFSDSLMNEEKMKTIEELTIKFETKEIAFKNKQLEQKVNEQKYTIVRNLFWLYGSLSIAVIIALVAIFYTRQNKLKISLQRMELEQQQYRAQMNPHFIFNCLNSIQHYIVHNDVRSANKFLSEFATLMRRTLDINAGHFITVQDEMSYLENYLLLEQMRFDGKFTCKVNCDDDIDRREVKLPTMMLQPFAENAIQHGIRYLPDSSGVVSISFKKEHGFLICMVDDNGIGRLAANKLKMQSGTTHVSQAGALIENKLSVLNNIYKANASLEVIDKMNTDGTAAGTTVILKFPFKWK